MVSIRAFNANDLEGVIGVWEAVFPDDPPHNAPRKVIHEKLGVDELIFVAEHGNKLVGACMAGYDGHRGWLYAVGVLPEYRRDKAGKNLVLHAIDALRELGCGKVNLQIRIDNFAVAEFYKSIGFDIEERMSMGMRI